MTNQLTKRKEKNMKSKNVLIRMMAVAIVVTASMAAAACTVGTHRVLPQMGSVAVVVKPGPGLCKKHHKCKRHHKCCRCAGIVRR